MRKNQITDAKERLKAYNKAQEAWEKRKLLDVNLLPFNEVCVDLIVANSNNNKANEPISVRIFNNQESINIGCLVIPNQFDEINTQEQFIADFESIRDQFDAMLLMNKKSNFTDFGFKKISSNDENNSITHYRNSCLDFDSFKEVFRSKSTVVMRTAIASGANRAMDAIVSTFAFPDVFRNKIVEIKNTIVCTSSGPNKCSDYEVNEIGKYSLDKIKRGMSFIYNTFEDLSLGNDIRVSVFIGCFDTVE